MRVSREAEMPTMPKIGARALVAQLEQSVSGDLNHDSIAAIRSSSSCAITVGSSWIVRLRVIVMGSRLPATPAT